MFERVMEYKIKYKCLQHDTVELILAYNVQVSVSDNENCRLRSADDM